jgi:hypothetical protein
MDKIPAGFRRIEGSMRQPAPGARLVGPANPDESVSVTIYLRRRPDAPPLLDHAHWAKTPPGKRNFLSRQEFASRYGAAQDDIDKVTKFATIHRLKVEETSVANCSVRVSGTVKQMNKAFAVELGNYESAKEKYRGREGHVHVPEELVDIVQSVLGLDGRRMGRPHNVPAGAGILTPPWVAQLYQFPSVPHAIKNQAIALIEMGGGYSQTDIDAYFGNGPNAGWSPLSAPNTTYPTPGLAEPTTAAGTLVEVDIGNGKNSPGTLGSGEVTLDIVVASSVAPGAKIVVYFPGHTGTGGNWTSADVANGIMTAIHDARNAPSVISYTWGGGPENDPNNGWTVAAMNTLNSALQAAAMMGVTVVVSSGDWGSDDAGNDGLAHVDFPASNPWVTACGGTIISNVNGASFDEGTWNDGATNPAGATGGGVSNFYPKPSWQTNAGVPASANPGGGTGRGVPDIAGNASPYSGYNIILGGTDPWPLPNGTNGKMYANGGTSIVAPLYAGLVAILNAYLGENVGFLNPTLYALNGTPVFRDINDGGNNENPTAGETAAPFYTSGSGWDACTGLGSVNGTALLNALQAMQPAVTLILDRSTFGKDEVNAAVNTGLGTYNDAFYVVVNGLTPDELGLNASNLNNPPSLPSLSGSFMGLVPVTSNDLSINFDGMNGVLLEQPGNFLTIQRITFPYNIKFTGIGAFSNLTTANPSQTYGLSAKITTPASASYPSITTPSSSTAEFELVLQPDPFMSAGPTWWLSDDMRVFSVTPATLPASKIPLAFSNTPYTSGPNTYIKALITELNTNFTNPATTNTPFTGLSAAEEQSALNLTGNDSNGNAVFNFALARVHLRGDTANNVRVFFRLFISSSPDTDFNTATTFRSGVETDINGNNISGSLISLLGFVTSDMSSTIPFFAEPRIDSTMEVMTRQTDPANVQIIPSPLAPAPSTGDEVYAYFGCWLDINQTTPRFPINPSAQLNPDGPYSSVLSIPALIMSNHACLVVEISYDPDPIPAGANASTSDKINQRNLAWAPSDNPGPRDSHRIPTLFDLRHTSKSVPNYSLPDELMIEWGNTPAGTIASIYWPQVNADDVLKLAQRFYVSSGLTKKDAHTIQCVTGSITYIPIPAGTGPNLAGLITVDLPMTVTVGQEFNIVVRRLTSKNPKLRLTGNPDTRNWRYVVGAFQIQIPVSTGPLLLKPEESVLALFKWKLESLLPKNRWYPVLHRYVQQVSGRVNGFGGNAGGVRPSQGGAGGGSTGLGGAHGHPHRVEFSGKVSGLAYNRFGDFEGFSVLTDEGYDRHFESREHEIEELVRDAWVERMLITVFAHEHHPHEPVSIVLRRMRRYLGR